MKRFLMYLGLLAFLVILENSGSGFLFSGERTYFFLFAMIAMWVVKRGFLSALPIILCTIVLFEGITQSTVGPLSLYGIFFAYGMSFLLKRIHLEYGGERTFLSVVVGIGMAGYPLFLSEYHSHAMTFFNAGLLGWGFFWNTLIGSAVFLILLSGKDLFASNASSRMIFSKQ